jgi:tetratricopeptide (TPR) repeat protein
MPTDPPHPTPARSDEAAALFATALDTAGEQPGDVIGSHTLLEIIGDGGFGRVWLAEQAEPVRRKVALKILKPGMDTDEVVSRFREEWKSLALMEHPGIARVFDAGVTPSGRPYFTMELVHGRPITAYCDSHALSLHERLRLFIKVCLAVQHAHQKGLIHRDLKPSNILVCEEDGVPAPRIIDFGVARALDDRATERSFVTRLHQIIGTPGYMSPEQADRDGRDLDTRTDIYSLGVVLYEMLTGTLPFEIDELARAALEAVLRQVREETPPQPSRRVTSLAADRATAIARHRGIPPDRLRAALRGDLDWIALKCLEKDRQRRYDTVGALADDLRLHLENRPVSARPPDRAYLLGRAIRRNRLAFALGSVALAALLAGVCVSTLFYLRERRARIQSEALRREAEAARNAANRARGSAEDIITWSLNDLREKLQPLGKLELLDDIGATADTYYQNLPPGERNAASETRRARVFLVRGDVLFQRNELPKAIELYREGAAILDHLTTADSSNDEGRKWHAVLVSRMGDALRGHGKSAEALAMRQRELELTRAVVAAKPDDSQRQHNLCIALRKLAECLYDERHFDAARAALEESIALSRSESPGHLPFALEVLAAWEKRAMHHEAAIKAYREVISLFAKAAEDAPDNVKERRHLVQCHCHLAEVLLRVDRIDEARAELGAARELRERLARIDPTNRDVLGDLGWLHLVNGELHLKENAETAALADFRETLRIYGDLSRKDPSFIFWYSGLDWLAKTCAPMASKEDASRPARMLVAEIHLTTAECRLSGGARDLARDAMAKARPWIGQLTQEAPDDPAVAEIMRRADTLRTVLGD